MAAGRLTVDFFGAAAFLAGAGLFEEDLSGFGDGLTGSLPAVFFAAGFALAVDAALATGLALGAALGAAFETAFTALGAVFGSAVPLSPVATFGPATLLTAALGSGGWLTVFFCTSVNRISSPTT